jgi:hypothetical protein
MTKRKAAVHNIARGLEHVCVFVATCSLGIVCEGEHRFESETSEAAAQKMLRDGWLDDFILGDGLNLACPSCVKYIREGKLGDFEKDEIDRRAGGTANAI